MGKGLQTLWIDTSQDGVWKQTDTGHPCDWYVGYIVCPVALYVPWRKWSPVCQPSGETCLSSIRHYAMEATGNRTPPLENLGQSWVSRSEWFRSQTVWVSPTLSLSGTSKIAEEDEEQKWKDGSRVTKVTERRSSGLQRSKQRNASIKQKEMDVLLRCSGV